MSGRSAAISKSLIATAVRTGISDLANKLTSHEEDNNKEFTECYTRLDAVDAQIAEGLSASSVDPSVLQDYVTKAQLAEVTGLVNDLSSAIPALAKKADVTAVSASLTTQSTNVSNSIALLESDIAKKATIDELTFVSGNVAKKADKSVVDSLSSNFTALNTAISENISAINTDISKKSDKSYVDTELAKKATPKDILDALNEFNITGKFLGSSTTFIGLPVGATNGDWVALIQDDGSNKSGGYVWNGTTYSYTFPIVADFAGKLTLKADVTYVNDELAKKANSTDLTTLISSVNTTQAAQDTKITALEARKEVKEQIDITTLIDGSIRPVNAVDSGFRNDGTGVLSGATSWSAWQAVGQNVGQSGSPDDIYEISAGFGSFTTFGSITFYINGVSRTYNQTGIQPGSLNMSEFNDNNWRGATVTVKGDFTGNVNLVGWNGSTYCGPVVRRKRFAGYTVDSKHIALSSDIPAFDPQAVLNATASKADKSYVDTELAKKANATDLTATNNTVTANKVTTDKTQTDLTALTSTVNAYKTSNDTAVGLKADKSALATTDSNATALTTRVSTAEGKITAHDASIASAIADWDINRTYSLGNRCIRNDAFFKSLKNGNKGLDPNSDTTGGWIIYDPTASASDITANRNPTGTDVKPIGVIWKNTAFGASSPLIFVSKGGGSWAYINSISLRAVRFYTKSQITSYTVLNSIRLYNSSGVQIPHDNWIWGSNGSGSYPPPAGTVNTGQGIGLDYNSTSWIELEPSSKLDLANVTISKALANFRTDKPSTGITGVEFYYSNGGKIYYSGPGVVAASDVQLFTADPNVKLQYGNNIESAQGPAKLGSELSSIDDLTFGRINGQEYSSAFSTLFQRQIAAYEARIAALESKVP